LETLLKHFDANYMEFSSFDKWKKQVDKEKYTWSTVHTEKFWQQNFVAFHISENLEYIKTQIAHLNGKMHDIKGNAEAIAVICFDLGEFARFFPRGRDFVSQHGAKGPISKLMTESGSTPELKREAITAYQKILMRSYGQ
jgi:V-type H+-transporting ATPase subunit H